VKQQQVSAFGHFNTGSAEWTKINYAVMSAVKVFSQSSGFHTMFKKNPRK
jgi:hypothetical protein